MPELLADCLFHGHSGGGVTVSGREPLLPPEFTRDLFGSSKQKEYTALRIPAVKHMDSNLHRQNTGASNARILENLKLLNDSGKPIEIRMPIIPGQMTILTKLLMREGY